MLKKTKLLKNPKSDDCKVFNTQKK